MLQSLAYVGLASTDLDEWTGVASGLLGLSVADRSRTGLAFRMDEYRQRLLVDASGDPGFFGWEVHSHADLDAIADRLDAIAIACQPLTRDEADRRCVAEGIWFFDPAGNRTEVVLGPQSTAEPFSPGRPMSGFRTGSLGFGHAVLTVEDAGPVVAFYRDVLGFRLSDYCYRPFTAYFFHLNPRHHSLAIIETGRAGVHHIMVETMNLDDVGQAHDIALEMPNAINVTLGRHSNDNMLSFYVNTPAGVLVEYGWGGKLLDPATWEAEELVIGPSLWGHERSWLPEDKRAEARQLRVEAAADGRRAPVHVFGDNYDVNDLLPDGRLAVPGAGS